MTAPLSKAKAEAPQLPELIKKCPAQNAQPGNVQHTRLKLFGCGVAGLKCAAAVSRVKA